MPAANAKQKQQKNGDFYPKIFESISSVNEAKRGRGGEGGGVRFQQEITNWFFSRVARWFIFKPKIQIWVYFGGP
jgi:hypothetical protein